MRRWAEDVFEQRCTPSMNSSRRGEFRFDFGTGETTPEESATRRYDRVRTLIEGDMDGVCKLRDLSVHICTWNVAQASPPEPDALFSWLTVGGDLPDIVCVGLQETDVSATAVMFELTSAYAEWIEAITTSLNNGASQRGESFRYGQGPGCVPVALVGLALLFVCKRHLASEISHVRRAVTRVGPMQLIGNKGGVGLRATICGKQFLFIAAHFVPHTGNASKRNNNFHRIISLLELEVPEQAENIFELALGTDAYAKLENNRIRHMLSFKPHRGFQLIDKHDYIFFFGDLNYRLSADRLGEINPRTAAENSNMHELLEADELRQEISKGEAFDGFCEGAISFTPTYKFVVGTNSYVRGPGARAPAWTDRILYKCWRPGYTTDTQEDLSFWERIKLLIFGKQVANRIEDPCDGSRDNMLVQQRYSSFPELSCSDHKPVSSRFVVSALSFDREKLNRIAKDTISQASD